MGNTNKAENRARQEDWPAKCLEREETIEIKIANGRALITRYWKGQAQESYRPNTLDGALVDVVSIIQGYQPPHCFRRLDIPVG